MADKYLFMIVHDRHDDRGAHYKDCFIIARGEDLDADLSGLLTKYNGGWLNQAGLPDWRVGHMRLENVQEFLRKPEYKIHGL